MAPNTPYPERCLSKLSYLLWKDEKRVRKNTFAANRMNEFRPNEITFDQAQWDRQYQSVDSMECWR